MNINSTMKLIFSAIIVGICVVASMVVYLSRIQVQAIHLADIRYLSYQAADELRQSSDDLTRLGRTYVVTGDEKYEKMYMDILDIRNGLKARPINYHTIYWDLVLSYGQKPKPDGVPIALQTMMEELGFSEKEFELLSQAQRNSDALVAMEVKAMNAVKGLFADSNGNYTVRGMPDREMAVQLLHSDDYHREKAKIMEPIEQFFSMLENRTEQQFADAAQKVRTAIYVAIGLLVFVVALTLVAYIIVSKKVIRPISSMAETLNKVGNQNDLSQRVSINSKDELGLIGVAINKVLESYSSTILKISQVNKTISNITKTISDTTDLNLEMSNQQSHELQMAASAMEEMTSALSTVAESTSNAERCAAVAEQESKSGFDVYKTSKNDFAHLSNEFVNTSVTIDELVAESFNVANVLDVIKNIAEQTNLLALNAAIEAARAGDQGRGFAVVADEVRSLAQRSQDSAVEIEKMISSLQSKGEVSTQTIRASAEKIQQTQTNFVQAENALSVIQASASEMHQVNVSIASATEEQLAVSNEISKNLMKIKDLSGEMNGAVGQLKPIVKELKNQVDDLSQVVYHFKT